VPDHALPSLPPARQMYARTLSVPPIEFVGRYAIGRSTASAAGHLTQAGYLPLEVAPPVILELAPAPVRLTHSGNELRVGVRAFDPATAEVRIALRVERDG